MGKFKLMLGELIHISLILAHALTTRPILEEEQQFWPQVILAWPKDSNLNPLSQQRP